MSKKIFLSFTLSDKELVQSFKEELFNQEESFEFVEHTIIEETENDWKEKVQKKIKSCDALLCLFGYSTWESDAVKWEVQKAIEFKKPTFLVKLKSTVFMIPNYIKENDIKILEDDPIQIINQIQN